MILDLTQNEDKIRLRVGDYNEPLLLPTSVYTTTLAENNNNINKCVSVIAVYILAIFAQQSHQKLQYMEVWGSEVYHNYRDWLMKVVLNPKLNQSSPIPYAGGAAATEKNKLIQFTEDWNNSFIAPNELEDLHNIAQYNGVV